MHVSSVPLRNGVPFFGRIHGDWQSSRAFKIYNPDGRPGYAAPPLYSEDGENGDMACTLVVSKEHLKDLKGTNKCAMRGQGLDLRFYALRA